MNECLLCKRDMKKSHNTFGNGCVKNMYKFLDYTIPKKVSLREKTLYRNIMKTNNFSKLNNNQQIWLADRYLTYQYLDRNPYGKFDTIKEQLNTDIQNVKKTTAFDEFITSAKIQLKQANDLFKKVQKFDETINKLKVENWTDEDKITALISGISYIFHMSKNKNQYEKNSFKAMQFAFWQTVIEAGGKGIDFTVAADFLQHSLEENPGDLFITEGNVIDEIKNDVNFIAKINEIINEFGKNQKSFCINSEDDNMGKYSVAFENNDLYFAIHNANIKVNGLKKDDKWNLKIHLNDTYDYSTPKDLIKYYNDTNNTVKSILSSTLYNLAALSNFSKVMKIYEIDIEFEIDNYEVI